MKRTLCTYALLAGMACSLAAQAAAPQKNQLLNEKSRTGITAFFTARLAGDEKTFDTSVRLKLKDVDAAREAVWQLWKEANEACEEEKLPAPAPLSEQSAGHWNLPEELEPNAVLNFYWGRKEAAGSPRSGRRPAPLPLSPRFWSTGSGMGHRTEDLQPFRRCSLPLLHSADTQRRRLLPLVPAFQTICVGEAPAAGPAVGQRPSQSHLRFRYLGRRLWQPASGLVLCRLLGGCRTNGRR